MSCPPQGCANCSGTGSNGNCTSTNPSTLDIEDCERELLATRQRTIDLERALANLKQTAQHTPRLRSRKWFDIPHDPSNTSTYVERYLNYGLTRAELQSGAPIIGIAQTGSDLAPCNRHHLELAKRVREGIRTAGGIAFEFPTHPIQETSKRPTACLDRNLAYLSLVEVLFGYPIDGVVLLTGCDKTTPACIMAAATVNIPAICLNVGPMLNGYFHDEKLDKEILAGSGTTLWKAREQHAADEIDETQFVDMVSRSAPSVGHCNTMGTASTMNALAEALGMALPFSASIPAPYRERGQAAYETGRTIVEMVHADRKPSDILTRETFENAIVACAAIGGSTNAPIHLNAVAAHVGVPLVNDDWDAIGHDIPLLLNMQPAGEFLGEEYHRAGGLPAILAELLDAGKLKGEALTCNGQTIASNVRGQHTRNRRVIAAYASPLLPAAGFAHLKGNLFDSAILKASVISPAFRKAFLSDPANPDSFTLPVCVFDGPEDYHERIDEAPVDANTILVMRGAGPLGYPGASEVVNMRPPAHLLRQGVHSLPCIGDGRQSGTSGSPSILNGSPEAAAPGGSTLAVLRDGDLVCVDIRKRRIDVLLSDEELETRRKELAEKGGYKIPASQTPWQEIFRKEAAQLNEGMVLKSAVKYQRISEKATPRHNH